MQTLTDLMMLQTNHLPTLKGVGKKGGGLLEERNWPTELWETVFRLDT